MIKLYIVLFFILFISCTHESSIKDKSLNIAITPPMGWNSWDCFGVDVNETEIKAVADYMAAHLKQCGWEYIVTDILWYGGENVKIANFKAPKPDQRIDSYGRLIPAENRYPSAVDGSFNSLVDYVHGKGLKFGIHIMRGIPWQAVEQNTPILDTPYYAKEIVAFEDTCVWYDGMYGINMDHPGGQAYYNSIVKLYNEWGIDFIKADDMSYPYHHQDIEALHNAIVKNGPTIVLSLSPGAAPFEQKEHLLQNANMWRISPDFWDDWSFLYHQFDLCKSWETIGIPGHWPDADMLPMGKLRKRGSDDYVLENMKLTMEQVTDEYSRFTDIEKQTMMTLWCIFRSPLMLGGYLPENDDVTTSLITNMDVISVNQNSLNNHQVYRADDKVVWAADVPGSQDKYAAFFNIGNTEQSVSLNFGDISINDPVNIFDLWAHTELGTFDKEFSVSIPAHGSCIYKLVLNRPF